MSICNSWDTIAAIIPASDFIGWGHPNIKKNCYDYCVKQLEKAGYKLRSAGWSQNSISSGLIYQTYLDSKVGKMNKGFQKTQFEKGVTYLKDAIKNKIPVMVGVDHSSGAANSDKVTDHFVVTVGMGTDTIGKYFLFYDNATGVQDVGTSDKNRIYCNCDDSSLIGTGDGRNSYLQSGYKQYTVTQIRESIKK